MLHCPQLKENSLKKMNGIRLINQMRCSIYLTNCRRSFFFQLLSIYLFSVTLFRVWSYDNQFSKIKFNLLKILEASQENSRAMLVKLQAFIPQFNQFHPGYYYQIASLDGCFWIYVCHTGESNYLSCMIKHLYFMH